MRIVETYSHLNGLEFLLVHKKRLWSEIKRVVNNLDAEGCKTKVSEESRTAGTLFYSPKDINACFRESLNDLGWHESRVKYWVTKDVRLIRQTLTLSPDEQKKEIVAAGSEPLFSFNQTDFVKDRIAVEVQFGKYPFVAYDLFVKHLAFYVGDKIDVGIEILPTTYGTWDIFSTANQMVVADRRRR